MKISQILAATVMTSFFTLNANALSLFNKKMTLTSSAFVNNGAIPYQYGYCQPDGKGRVKLGKDISPPLSWTHVPGNTKSFVLLMSDPYIPNVPYFDLPGHEITATAPRGTGYHWVVVDIPASRTSLPEGAGSKGFVASGKAPGKTPYGLMGINVYNGVFQAPIASRIEFGSDTAAKIKGLYGRYDGPCAPWNDAVEHRYVLTLYALDVASLNLPSNGHFTGKDVLAAMQGHILSQSILTAKFVTNARLMNKK